MAREAIAAFSLLGTQGGARLSNSARVRHRYMHRRPFRFSRLSKIPQKCFDSFLTDIYVVLVLGSSFQTTRLSAKHAFASVPL